MNHVMLDLETMGSGSNAAIVAIGAVAFDLESAQLGPEFYATVDMANSVINGGVIDADTVYWWLRQSDDARQALLNGTKESISSALARFSAWIDQVGEGDKFVWGNGAAFDNVILANAYRNMHMAAPWKHWNDRCYRTVKALHPGVKMQRQGTHHNALDDAKSQALHLIAMLTESVETTNGSQA